MAISKDDQWIIDATKDKLKTFADVGGLWGVPPTVNEKITIAYRSGAFDCAMIDIVGSNNYLWYEFNKKCSSNEIECLNISANIDQFDFVNVVGVYDIVHCSGVIYHCPNPLHTISNLTKITKDILIIGSVRIPNVISNSKGIISLDDGAALFVPSINDTQKSIIGEFMGSNNSFIGINKPKDNWNKADYSAFWYLFTDLFIEGLIKVNGFKIIDKYVYWGDKAVKFLCKRDVNVLGKS